MALEKQVHFPITHVTYMLVDKAKKIPFAILCVYIHIQSLQIVLVHKNPKIIFQKREKEKEKIAIGIWLIILSVHACPFIPIFFHLIWDTTFWSTD